MHLGLRLLIGQLMQCFRHLGEPQIQRLWSPVLEAASTSQQHLHLTCQAPPGILRADTEGVPIGAHLLSSQWEMQALDASWCDSLSEAR